MSGLNKYSEIWKNTGSPVFQTVSPLTPSHLSSTKIYFFFSSPTDLLIFIYLYVYVCLIIYVEAEEEIRSPGAGAGAGAVASHSLWVMGTELRSSGETVHAFIH